MASLPDVIGLLYRANWTRLSLSADIRSGSDRDLAQRRWRTTRPPEFPDRPAGHFRADPDGGPPIRDKWPEEERGGYRRRRAALLMAPGGRYRQEFGDDPPSRVQGSDGERSWIWYRPDLEPGPGFSVFGGNEPPSPELLCPAELLSGFSLEVRGPVTACGRDAIAVVATPRTSIGHGGPLRPARSDLLEVIVDAELGILLRRETTFEGQRLALTELTAVVLSPPEAADSSRFAPPAGSHISHGAGESLRQTFSGPPGASWMTSATGTGAALRPAAPAAGEPVSAAGGAGRGRPGNQGKHRSAQRSSSMLPGPSCLKYLRSSSSISATSAAAACLISSRSGSRRPVGVTKRRSQVGPSADPSERNREKRPITQPSHIRQGIPYALRSTSLSALLTVKPESASRVSPVCAGNRDSPSPPPGDVIPIRGRRHPPARS
jgi:hypothetical protein